MHTPESADELDLVGLVAEVPATGANRQQGIDQQSNTDQHQQAVEQQATGSSCQTPLVSTADTTGV